MKKQAGAAAREEGKEARSIDDGRDGWEQEKC